MTGPGWVAGAPWSDRQLSAFGRGVGHPARAAILRTCCESQDATHRPVELAASLGLSLGVVSYHMRVLQDLGLILLWRTRPVRGTLAHEYKLADGVADALSRTTGHGPADAHGS